MPKGEHPAALNVRVVSPWQWRVNVLRAEDVKDVRIRICRRERDIPWQPPLHGQRRLHNIRCPQAGAHSLDRLRSEKSGKAGGGWNVREKIRRVLDVLLLNDSVVALGRQSVRQG